MLKFPILIVIFSFNFYQAIGQTDTLNRVDIDGKKTGWCISYLDENLKVLEDSTDARYCMYNYYRRDIWLYRFGEGYGTKKHPIIFPSTETKKLGGYILLHGQYSTKYDNGTLRSVLFTKDGFMTAFKFYYPTGQLKFEIIVSKDCGAPTQHCLKEYKKKGLLKFEGHTYLPKEK